ncbi:MAG: hypothetical protein Q8R25_02420 [bacterium]|nr:hypothetical protein [bacterium]
MQKTENRKQTEQNARRTSSGERGVTVILVIGYMVILSIILGTVSSYGLTQSKHGGIIAAREQALHVAEAGLEYYRWFLAHNPTIMESGVGLVTPITYTVEDPEGGEIGDATVTATASLQCGVPQWIDIQSEGTSNANPLFQRKLSARYMKSSSAEYSYIVNSNVFAGADRTIRGPYHSNGGVRMDATHNSEVTSSATTWNCTTSYGCNPAQSAAPGVVGNGSNPALWTSGVTTISIFGNEIDFVGLKTKAQTQGGIYYAPSTGSVAERGYHLTFNPAGTVTVKRVTSTDCVDSNSSQYGWGTECSIITASTILGTYAIPSACSLIFAEDRLWIEGTVKGKLTVIAATPSDSGTSPDIYLKNNILYNAYDGTDGITLVAERSVLIPLQVPENMEIHGIFIGKNGHYGRDQFTTSGSHQVPSQYDSYVQVNTLTTVGTVVSNGRTGTSWKCGGVYCSGFATRNDFYDQQLAFSPPPFTPTALVDYKFALWREN